MDNTTEGMMMEQKLETVKKRGRPTSDAAMTNAERQRKHREKVPHHLRTSKAVAEEIVKAFVESREMRKGTADVDLAIQLAYLCGRLSYVVERIAGVEEGDKILKAWK